MRLSILIPMYNAEAYIGNCIESLLNQDMAEDEYEIIIMDDGSNDNSVAIASGFAKDHKQIKLYKEPNSGAYHTRNKLLKLAQGDYIYNLDADDYVVKHALKPLLDFAALAHLDIIGFKTEETASLSKVELKGSINEEHLQVCTGKAFLEKHPLMRHEPWWYFVRRDFLSENGFVFNNNQYNADVTFTLNAFLVAKKVGFMDVSIHRYVQSEDSIMRSTDFEIIRKRMEYMQMMVLDKSRLINEAKQHSSEDLIQNLTHRRDVFTFFNLIKLIKSPFKLGYVKNVVNTLKSVGAYPINDFNRYRYNTLQYRILRKIINSESILYVLVSVRSIFSKSLK